MLVSAVSCVLAHYTSFSLLGLLVLALVRWPFLSFFSPVFPGFLAAFACSGLLWRPGLPPSCLLWLAPGPFLAPLASPCGLVRAPGARVPQAPPSQGGGVPVF